MSTEEYIGYLERMKDKQGKLLEEASYLLSCYIDDMARAHPNANATDGMLAAYNWQIKYDNQKEDIGPR